MLLGPLLLLELIGLLLELLLLELLLELPVDAGGLSCLGEEWENTLLAKPLKVSDIEGRRCAALASKSLDFSK